TSQVRSACESLGYSSPPSMDWEIPPTKEMGDVSFRIGFQLAKAVGRAPAAIAGEIASRINSQQLQFAGHLVAAVEANPKGFLNFRFNPGMLFTSTLQEAARSDYGYVNLGKGQTVLVEHTSVNPNKALHVGHLRNLALGDSIARILRFTNHSVDILNYIDDSGLQVADVIVGIMYLGHPQESLAGVKFDHYAGDEIYVDVNRKYETDPALKEKQKLILQAIEARDPKIFPLAASVTDKILKEQLRTCWRFKASYDLLVYESDIIASKLWEEVFGEMKIRGIATLETEGKLAGCWIVSIKGEKEGEDKVLVRSDGTATYVAKDIPFAALKTGLIRDRFTYRKYVKEPDEKQLWRTSIDPKDEAKSPVSWGAQRSITSIGSEQSRLQRVIGSILGQLSGVDFSQRYIHLGYALVSLSLDTVAALSGTESEKASSGSVRMSGRKGLYVNADDVFEAVKKSALEETKKRHPDVEDASWFDQIAETLSLSAIRFALLKQDLDKTITFDLEESLKLMGETGPYMLYTYARAMNILAKADSADQKESSLNGGLLSTESEIELLTILSKYDLTVEKAVRMLAPKWIAHYSFEMCEAFNKFYEKNRVIQEPNAQLRRARLRQVACFSNVLKSALGLLGIEVLLKI
ncbi:MAG TPA: arginine--tRNA ligase, partial [Nitrososphaerales archaeon]|nr:arginine--tRNA ligase [Nitrososphaerales archaeon]